MDNAIFRGMTGNAFLAPGWSRPNPQETDGPHSEKFQPGGFPSFTKDENQSQGSGEQQMPLDLIDEASMESFPCSDPPSYTSIHS